MTNLQSIAGGMIWTAVAGLLMLVALEPVAIEKNAPQPAIELAAADADQSHS